ncbi:MULTISPECIES: hypothetical protein [unclassified Burkholderia]|uniref:hypothetical protein n=1 Tax=unclassified Burkholderia TaxID=2613784 RepID=UPI0014214FB6|nr:MULTISPECIES: hypothetical protein [unclassified Burkholderia]NIE86725.1 hypothetical protein [Burkholderia sp. Tr-860]NIF66059.1 hypothetical protein [Burkholderia sp. Cy-647]NIF99622.1 hypothetical protein [Burkholderia sp. Ax-1720]
MSIATIVRRWLAARLGAAQTAGIGSRGTRWRRAEPVRALRWRAPWLPWQLLSWVLTSMLAPPFWIVGTLLLINPDSDQPFFWVAAMAIVPVANGIAMVAANQRHHQAPFASRAAVAACLFAVAIAVSCTLFALLLWGSRSAAELVGLLALAPGTAGGPTALSRIVLLVGSFGIASSLHAAVLHAWLAFEE